MQDASFRYLASAIEVAAICWWYIESSVPWQRFLVPSG